MKIQVGDDVTVFGGDGVDTLRLVSTTPRTFTNLIGAEGAIQGFEALAFAGTGLTLMGEHRGWQSVTFEAGSTTVLDGSLDDVNALALSAALTHAWQDYEFERVIVVGSDVVTARAESEGATSSLQAEAFYDLLWTPETRTGFGLGPLITVDATTSSINRFKEQGAGILNLLYTGETADQVVAGAGALATYTGTLFGDTRAEGGLRVTLESVSGDRTFSTDAVLAVPGAAFTPSSAALDAERVSIGADAKVHFTDRVFGYIRYDTVRGENLIDHEGWAGLTLKF